MASPDSMWPPGEDTSMSIGASEAAESAMRRRTVSAASVCSMVPNKSTVRDSNALASRKALGEPRGSVVGVLTGVSMAKGEELEDTLQSCSPHEAICQ